MRICLIGECRGNPDEGMKKITYTLGVRLSLSHDVITLSPFDVWQRGFWNRIHRFSPDVIHYVPGPSIYSFAIAKGLALFERSAPVIMSTPLPMLSPISLQLVRFLRPDAIITQSSRYLKVFDQMGLKVIRCPLTGVDITTFTPLAEDRRAVVRRALGVGPESFVILHVGHIKRGRNIEIMSGLQEELGTQVVIVGSTSTGIDQSLQGRLADRGCIVVTKYLGNINEVYASADCYVFPVTDERHSIQAPLSVLEAMSCNCPVISTRFGALPDMLSSDEGLWFAENERDFVGYAREITKNLKTHKFVINTRKKALEYSWDVVTARLEEVYQETVDSFL